MKLPEIKILGLGGAGSNCAKSFSALGREFGAECAAFDTDYRTLADAPEISERIFINSDSTAQFLNRPREDEEFEIGLKEAVLKTLNGVELLVVMAGMGGETGSELAGSIARIAHKRGIPTIAFCIMPLSAEGSGKREKAERDFAETKKYSRAAVALPNDSLLPSEGGVGLSEAFAQANMCVARAAAALSGMFRKNGIINVDFSAFSKMFSDNVGDSETAFSIGKACGENFSENAVESFKNCPLFNKNIGIKRAIVNFECPPDFDILKMRSSFSKIAEILGNPQNIAFGACVGKSETLEICAVGIGTKKIIPKIYDETPITEEENEVSDFNEESSLPEERPLHSKIQSEDKIPESIPDIQPKKSPEQKSGIFGFSKKKTDDLGKQNEFSFVEMSQQRGFFADTPPNMRGGEDLDVPTYMRRNVKIDL